MSTTTVTPLTNADLSKIQKPQLFALAQERGLEASIEMSRSDLTKLLLDIDAKMAEAPAPEAPKVHVVANGRVMSAEELAEAIKLSGPAPIDMTKEQFISHMATRCVDTEITDAKTGDRYWFQIVNHKNTDKTDVLVPVIDPTTGKQMISEDGLPVVQTQIKGCYFSFLTDSHGISVEEIYLRPDLDSEAKWYVTNVAPGLSARLPEHVRALRLVYEVKVRVKDTDGNFLKNNCGEYVLTDIDRSVINFPIVEAAPKIWGFFLESLSPTPAKPTRTKK